MSASQQWKQQELNLGPVAGRRADRSSEAFVATHLSESPTGQIRLMESILERENIDRARRQVIANKGAPGVDGMKTGQLDAYLKRHWPKIRESLLEGSGVLLIAGMFIGAAATTVDPDSGQTFLQQPTQDEVLGTARLHLPKVGGLASIITNPAR